MQLDNRYTPEDQQAFDKLEPKYQQAFIRRLGYMTPIVEDSWKYHRTDETVRTIERRAVGTLGAITKK